MNNKLLLAAGLCLGMAINVQAGTNGEVQKAIQEAKAAYKKADSVQGAWVNTPKLIKKAEAVAAKGDKAKALKLAAEAKKQAELGYAQAVHERANWSPPPYIR